MADVTILIPAGPPPAPHRQATIVQATGASPITATVPLLDSVGLDGIGSKWTYVERPGRDDLSIHRGKKSPTASLVVVIGDDITRSAEDTLRRFHWLSMSSSPVIVTVGQMSRWSSTGTWVIDDMSVEPIAFVQGSNDIAIAEVTIALRAALTPDQLRST